MCLGVPGRVVEMRARDAVVDFWGIRRAVSLDIVDEPVGLGDYVLVHVGFAIRRIPEDEVLNTLAFFEQLAREDLEGLSPGPRPGPGVR